MGLISKYGELLDTPVVIADNTLVSEPKSKQVIRMPNNATDIGLSNEDPMCSDLIRYYDMSRYRRSYSSVLMTNHVSIKLDKLLDKEVGQTCLVTH